MQAEVRNQIWSLAARLETQDINQILAGLAVLARDMNTYLDYAPRDDSELFEKVYQSTIEQNIEAQNRLESPQEYGLPVGIAASIDQGEIDISPLLNRDIVHEWTVFPGDDLQERFMYYFGDSICEDGLQQKFQEGRFGTIDLPVVIASGLLTQGLSPDVFWVPFSVFLSMALARKGISDFCDKYHTEGTNQIPDTEKSESIDWDAAVDAVEPVDVDQRLEQHEFRLNRLERHLVNIYQMTDPPEDDGKDN